MKSLTVLMTVYNEQERFLERAIKSILHQTFSDFEFLIVNDGSTEESCLHTLKKYAKQDSRIRILHQEKNQGLTVALNQGLLQAQGEYVARIDSNDMAHPVRLAKQLSFMESHPEHALCGSWSYIINEDDEIIGQKKFSTRYPEIRRNILRFNFFTHSSLFFRRDVIRKVGGYTPEAKKAQDYDLILKIAAKHPVANLGEFLCFYRISPSSISESQYKKQEYFACRARINAVTSYGYHLWESYRLILPLLSLLFIPTVIKKFLIRVIH